MLERKSALAAVHPFRSDLLKIEEAAGFTLTQFATGDEGGIARIVGIVPERVGTAVEAKGRTLFRIGPRQFWAVGPADDDLAQKLEGRCAVTPLSSSRCRILLQGIPARDVLAKGIAIDFHERSFVPGAFALTGVHHMPLLVHCIAQDGFHLYAMRTFAVSVYEWLADAALEYSHA